MPIAFDAASQSSPAEATTVTWSHTCSGSDRLLVVGVHSRDDDPTEGVTYNGVVMTEIRQDHQGGNVHTSLWYLKAPATGAHDIVATHMFSAPAWIAGSAVSLTGVDQTTPLDAHNGATGDSTTIADRDIAVSGVTDRAGMSTEGPVSPASATTMSWTTAGGSDGWATSAASFKPGAAAAASLPPRRCNSMRRHLAR